VPRYADPKLTFQQRRHVDDFYNRTPEYADAVEFLAYQYQLLPAHHYYTREDEERIMKPFLKHVQWTWDTLHYKWLKGFLLTVYKQVLVYLAPGEGWGVVRRGENVQLAQARAVVRMRSALRFITTCDHLMDTVAAYKPHSKIEQVAYDEMHDATADALDAVRDMEEELKQRLAALRDRALLNAALAGTYTRESVTELSMRAKQSGKDYTNGK
jgi:hypothetical protein